MIFLKIVTPLLQDLQTGAARQSNVIATKITAMTKLLMVCMGNICRSPMAQIVAQKLTSDAMCSHQLMFDSAGTHAHRLGEPSDPRAQAALSSHGYDAGRIRSRKITQLDFQNFDMLLAMDARNLHELRRLSPPEHLNKLRLFLTFAEGLDETEVADPYYGNREGFERVLTLCEAGARGLIKHWTTQRLSTSPF